MNAVVIETPTESDVRLLLDLFKRIGVEANVVDMEELEDAYLVSLMEERLNSESDSESVSIDEILTFLRQR